MTCMTPIAPATDVIGRLSSLKVRPPLSMRITALIQSSETLKRLDASLMSGAQRAMSSACVIACSFKNSGGVSIAGSCAVGAVGFAKMRGACGAGAGATARAGGDGTTLEKPVLVGRKTSVTARLAAEMNFPTLRNWDGGIDEPVLRPLAIGSTSSGLNSQNGDLARKIK